MPLLYFLESIRMPGLNAFMLTVTRLGEETAFLVAALIVFWCVDKRKGYYVMAVGFFGTIANQFLKLLCRVPRPWVLDPNFTILEQAREAAAGFSFPSGHSTSSVGTFGSLALCLEKKWLKRVSIAVCVLVPLSRMYLGVHTPYDVLAGAATALVLIVLLRGMVQGISERRMWVYMGVLLCMAAGLLLFTENYPFVIAQDQMHNLHSGEKNAYTMLGCILGLMIGYPLEARYVKFDTKAVWWAQILKTVLGLLVVLAVKEGLRAPLDALFAGHMAARAVRYGLIVLVAGCVWPMSFQWFAKLGVKK